MIGFRTIYLCVTYMPLKNVAKNSNSSGIQNPGLELKIKRSNKNLDCRIYIDIVPNSTRQNIMTYIHVFTDYF